MPAAFDALADRATARLAGDPELRLEVRRELLTHLDSAAADYAAAGDADPITAAANDLGAPDVLADRLWQAHRRRIARRLWARRAVWLLPAVLAVVAAGTAASALRSAAPVIELCMDHYAGSDFVGLDRATASDTHAAPPLVLWTRHLTEARLTGLPADRRLLLPTHAAPSDDDAIATAHAAADLSARHPSDRVLAAHAAVRASWAARLTRDHPEVAQRAALEAIARGAALDPHNGLYPSLRAACLVRRATEPVDRDPNPVDADAPPEPVIIQPQHDGRPGHAYTASTRRVTDPPAFAEAQRALHDVVACSRSTDDAADLRRRVADAAPAAVDVPSLALRAMAVQRADDTFPRSVLQAVLLNDLAAVAVQQAVDGDAAAALHLIADTQAAAAVLLRGQSNADYLFRNDADYLVPMTATVLRLTGHPAEARRADAWAAWAFPLVVNEQQSHGSAAFARDKGSSAARRSGRRRPPSGRRALRP